jgi:hypothetical protein
MLELRLTPLLNSRCNIQRDRTVLTVAEVVNPASIHFGVKTPPDLKMALQGESNKRASKFGNSSFANA